jgi:hypothetical protein
VQSGFRCQTLTAGSDMTRAQYRVTNESAWTNKTEIAMLLHMSGALEGARNLQKSKSKISMAHRCCCCISSSPPFHMPVSNRCFSNFALSRRASCEQHAEVGLFPAHCAVTATAASADQITPLTSIFHTLRPSRARRGEHKEGCSENTKAVGKSEPAKIVTVKQA